MFVNKEAVGKRILQIRKKYGYSCLLYTSDAADE